MCYQPCILNHLTLSKEGMVTLLKIILGAVDQSIRENILCLVLFSIAKYSRELKKILLLYVAALFVYIKSLWSSRSY